MTLRVSQTEKNDRDSSLRVTQSPNEEWFNPIEHICRPVSRTDSHGNGPAESGMARIHQRHRSLCHKIPAIMVSTPSTLPDLYISSFPPNQSVRAVIVPDKGATISILRAPVGIKTADQWVALRSDATKVKSRNSMTAHGQKAEGSSLVVIEVIYGSIEGPDTATWYFEISGQIFAANLSYWEGDPNLKTYRAVLRDMIQSFKLLRKE